MSRVDEALRRAAALNSDTQIEPDGLPTDVGSTPDDVVLSRALFPVETPVGRSSSTGPAVAPDPVPPPAPPGGPERSLLDRIDARLAQKVVVDKGVLPSSREQYRRLAAALHHAQGATGIKVVMITSAVPGEGKTLTASNLGLTFSESYHRKVLLIDADLRQPALHVVFGADNKTGLAEGLISRSERRLPVQQLADRLSIVTAGQPSADPMAGLTSERMRRVLDEAREAFDWVFIDTPPVAFLSDANLLARMVDGAVVVVKAGSTSFELVQRAIESVGRDRTIGVVLNRADPSEDPTGYANYYQSYPAAAGQDAKG